MHEAKPELLGGANSGGKKRVKPSKDLSENPPQPAPEKKSTRKKNHLSPQHPYETLHQIIFVASLFLLLLASSLQSVRMAFE